MIDGFPPFTKQDNPAVIAEFIFEMQQAGNDMSWFDYDMLPDGFEEEEPKKKRKKKSSEANKTENEKTQRSRRRLRRKRMSIKNPTHKLLKKVLLNIKLLVFIPSLSLILLFISHMTQ